MRTSYTFCTASTPNDTSKFPIFFQIWIPMLAAWPDSKSYHAHSFFTSRMTWSKIVLEISDGEIIHCYTYLLINVVWSAFKYLLFQIKNGIISEVGLNDIPRHFSFNDNIIVSWIDYNLSMNKVMFIYFHPLMGSAD